MTSLAPVFETSTGSTAVTPVRELLVLRRHPEGSIGVIGRLRYDGAHYSYRYTRGAQRLEDFQPVVGLGEPGEVSRSEELFPVFRQRIMRRRRPGYERYMRQLGADPDGSESEWWQLIRSGGYRVGDSLRFLPVPEVRDGAAHARFLVHGVRHMPGWKLLLDGETRTVGAEEHERALDALRPGDRLGLVPEPGNRFSSRALLVASAGTPLGYVPDVIAEDVAELRAAAELTVEHIADPAAPPHRRLFVRLRAPAPNGFRFDRAGEWEPVERSV